MLWSIIYCFHHWLPEEKLISKVVGMITSFLPILLPVRPDLAFKLDLASEMPLTDIPWSHWLAWYHEFLPTASLFFYSSLYISYGNLDSDQHLLSLWQIYVIVQSSWAENQSSPLVESLNTLGPRIWYDKRYQMLWSCHFNNTAIN